MCTSGISTPHPPIGTVEGNGTSLSVRWTTTEGATGYIVMATSYTGRLRNETLMKVVFGPANGTAGLSLSTLIPFNVECSSKFTFKVAAFNNFGMGPYTDETEVRIRHKNCDSFSGECSADVRIAARKWLTVVSLMTQHNSAILEVEVLCMYGILSYTI